MATTMVTAVPASGDFFVGKKSKFSRDKERARSTMIVPKASGRRAKQLKAEAELVLEQRDHLIRLTIANRSLQTHFQPIVDLGSGEAIGTEALTRFGHQPVRPPDVWFAEAAAVGLGVELELAALHSALGQLHRLPSGLYLSLNASVETILSDQFQGILDDVAAERIVLELTEHTPINDYLEFERGLSHLRSRGVRLAVDDAGAGFSSFRHILDLKPDVIKLDVALTRDIDTDPARQALGRALLTFGLETYNTTIVAEGIETKGELAMLRSLGCPSGQGFFLGRPSPLRPDRPPSVSLPTLVGFSPPSDA